MAALYSHPSAAGILRESTAELRSMAVLDILQFPDSRLRKVAEPVSDFDQNLGVLIDDMIETMYEASGIGLAATQVNVHQRVFVMDLSEDRSAPQAFVNPVISVLDEETDVRQEGCLSIPGFYEDIARPRSVRIDAKDRTGADSSATLDGLAAVCVQHEVDHLDGKLFLDYLSALKRQRIRRKLEKAQKQSA